MSAGELTGLLCTVRVYNTNVLIAVMEPSSLVFVNLRVISKLQPGDRLQCADSRYFGIDRGYFSFLWRWMKADGRALTLERLEETMREAGKVRLDPHVQSLLTDAACGLRHLMDTYHTDPTTVARLETILVLCGESTEARQEVEQAL